MEQKKFITTFIAVVVTLIAGYYFFAIINAQNSADLSGGNYEEGVSGLKLGADALFIGDQVPGGKIQVLAANLSKIGYVVIHESSPSGRGAVVGQSLLLPPGQYQNLLVSLRGEYPSGSEFIGMLYADDGDGVFNINSDTVITVAGGIPVVADFSLKEGAVPPQIVF